MPYFKLETLPFSIPTSFFAFASKIRHVKTADSSRFGCVNSAKGEGFHSPCVLKKEMNSRGGSAYNLGFPTPIPGRTRIFLFHDMSILYKQMRGIVNIMFT